MSNKNNRESKCPVSLTLGDCHILTGGTAGGRAKEQRTPQSSPQPYKLGELPR